MTSRGWAETAVPPPPDKQKTCPRPFALPLYLPRLLKGLRGGPS
ncbi:hypothetical protein JM93_03720, partial [Roseibium hamelinense]